MCELMYRISGALSLGRLENVAVNGSCQHMLPMLLHKYFCYVNNLAVARGTQQLPIKDSKLYCEVWSKLEVVGV